MSQQLRSYLAVLKGVSYRHSFVSFPQHWRSHFENTNLPTFQLDFEDSNSLVLSWAGHTHEATPGNDVIYVSSKMLQANGIPESSEVFIRQLPPPPSYSDVSFVTLSSNYWEEIMLNSAVAEENMLSQFRVIKKDQVFPLWLEGGVVIFLKVSHISPSLPYGYLQLNAHVEIQPPQDLSCDSLNLKPSVDDKTEVANNIYSNALGPALNIILKIFGYDKNKLMIFPKQEILLNFKSVPFIFSTEQSSSLLYSLINCHPSLVIISKNYLWNSKYEHELFFITKIFNIKKSQEAVGSSSQTPQKELDIETFYATVLIWERVKSMLGSTSCAEDIELILRHRTCILSTALRKKLSAQNNTIIILETSDCSLENHGKFILDANLIGSFSGDKTSVKDCITSQFNDLVKICPIIINDHSIITLPNIKKEILLKIRGGNTVYLEQSNILLLDINIETNVIKEVPNTDFREELIKNPILPENHKNTINERAFQTLFRNIKCDLNLNAKSNIRFPQFTLLQGSKGSGKTELMRRLVNKLSSKPFYVHCEVIHLKLLKGKKVESVAKILKQAIKNAYIYQSSILALEDLDALLPAISPEEEKGALNDYVTSMAHMIRDLLRDFLDNLIDERLDSKQGAFVSVIGTCLFRSNFHSVLSSPIGDNLFQNSMSISPLNKEERYEMLESFIKEMYCDFLKENYDFDISGTSFTVCNYNKTTLIDNLEGVMLSEVKTLSLRIFLEARKRWKEDIIDVIRHNINLQDCSSKYFNFKDEDVDKAFEGFVSISSRALKSRKQNFKKKIGGLKEAQQALEEMIHWPSQYPHLFSQTKLRLRSGIMLYGPPGCGKTHLAYSLQGHPHLNFIAVKGPEVLSKYIGQSEKAIRDIFERAQNAKPCVIFFDEFESIASRRGQDSTGVTDRVVNQLLTQMDGVEGLSQVYVVAATSRPDLIDPALLRPGRLDKCIYCPIPNEEERAEILSILIEEVTIDKLVDIQEIANRTEGFSGADLQSLLSTAQIQAAREEIGKSMYNEITEEENNDYEFVQVISDTSSESNEGSSSKATNKDFNGSYADSESYRTEEATTITITEERLLKSLSETVPSIREKERKKHESLHRMFSVDKQSFGNVKAGQRETLA